jgi:hypothetical protein
MKLQKMFQKFEKSKEIIQNHDTQKIQQVRLVRIIQNNKEKVKVLDEYIKKMYILTTLYSIFQAEYRRTIQKNKRFHRNLRFR